MTDPQRFVLVGCGKISINHVEAFRFLENATLVAVCDADPDRSAAAAARAGGIPSFHDMDEMFRSVSADCALVGTPSGLHPEHAERAAAAGLHVVTEKPMAVSVAAADQMMRACAQHDRRLFVIKQLRYLPVMQRLVAALRGGSFGKLYFGQMNLFCTRPQSYYDEASWRGTLALDGGVLLNQASHYIDLLLWLMGEVATVQGVIGTLGRSIEAEDTAAATLRFENGALGAISATVLTYPKNLEGSLVILGERGTVKLGGPGLSQLEAWDVEDQPAPSEEERAVFSKPGEGHAAYLREVIAALRGEGTAPSEGSEGRKSIALVEAIQRSSNEGKPVVVRAL